MTEKDNILDTEHEELLEGLGEVARRKDEVGRIFDEVLRLFRSHMDKENQTIVPLLGYLRERLGDFNNQELKSLRKAAADFETGYPGMLEEHLEISRLIKMAMDEIGEKPDKMPLHLSHELLHHVSLEEELLYPAAFASGDLLDFEREELGRKIKY